jgi:hypothetical protein
MPKIECPSGLVLNMRKMKGREIVAVASQSDDTDSSTNMQALIGTCWNETIDSGPYPYVMPGNETTPPWIRLLKGDVLHVFIQLRRLSLLDGNDYNFPVKCEECGKRYDWTLPLDVLPVFKLSEASKAIVSRGELFEHVTADGTKVTFDLQKMAQESDIAKLMKAQGRTRTTMLDTLAGQIQAINGKATPIKFRFDWLQDLDLDEITRLQEAFEAADCGIDTKIETVCTHCKWKQAIPLPFGKSFFTLVRAKVQAPTTKEEAPPT